MKENPPNPVGNYVFYRDKNKFELRLRSNLPQRFLSFYSVPDILFILKQMII